MLKPPHREQWLSALAWDGGSPHSRAHHHHAWEDVTGRNPAFDTGVCRSWLCTTEAGQQEQTGGHKTQETHFPPSLYLPVARSQHCPAQAGNSDLLRNSGAQSREFTNANEKVETCKRHGQYRSSTGGDAAGHGRSRRSYRDSLLQGRALSASG